MDNRKRMFENQINEDDLHNIYVENLKPVGEIGGFQVRPGFYNEDGAFVIPGGVSFTVHSQNAYSFKLVLFRREETEPYAVLPFPENYRIGNVWSMIVFGLDIEEFEYAYLADGPYDPEKGLIFDSTKYLLDPYAKAVAGQHRWGRKPQYGMQYRARVVASDFDWGDSMQPCIPAEDLVIYELHTRGFTIDPSSGVKNPGTFDGLTEKIPYLLELGVNAVELMPIFEFDEMRDIMAVEGRELFDYWGYNPVCFFAPNTSYVARPEYNREGRELKTLIKKLHENGIEVILDVVFNHTAEGNELGPYISLKGFDNNVYYMLDPEGKYYNFSGCGNTLNCNHPIVKRMILECLRYWVVEYRVDGFRFDLASILGRNEDGSPLSNPPLLKNLAFDPILARVKLIAEAWDAGGMYQVGTFPSWNRWSEWNGKYRDDIRRFLKGDAGLAHTAAERIAGSRDMYEDDHTGCGASVNFITCHDGFTLNDLYTYNRKHNEANGWDNTDGENSNNSWNCGVEGPTEDREILELRRRMVKNAVLVLFSSHGTPMILAGDEFGNTQYGNNNAYCQDNRISWLDWNMPEDNRDLFEFFRRMIRLRRMHPVMSRKTGPAHCGFPHFSRHGVQPWHLDNWEETRVLGVMFAGRNLDDTEDDIVYIAINTYWEKQEMVLPELPAVLGWRVAVDTYQAESGAEGQDRELESEKEIETEMPEAGGVLELGPRSAALLLAVKKF
nr:glycogen debranching protein GlgX [Anaerobium acetethylicum]